jgi:hypothetical protein
MKPVRAVPAETEFLLRRLDRDVVNRSISGPDSSPGTTPTIEPGAGLRGRTISAIAYKSSHTEVGTGHPALRDEKRVGCEADPHFIVSTNQARDVFRSALWSAVADRR